MKYICMTLCVGITFLSLNANAAVKPFKCQAAVIMNDYFEESLSLDEYPDVSFKYDIDEYGFDGVKTLRIGSSLYRDGDDHVVIKDDLPNFGFRETVQTFRSDESGYEKITVTREGTNGEIFVEYKFDGQTTDVSVKVAELEGCSLIK